MRIALDYGHCLKGYDLGARGCGFKEEELNRAVGKKVKTILEKNGHEVIQILDVEEFDSVGRSISYRWNKANQQSLDFFISIHFNSFNGKAEGTELYTFNGNTPTVAKKILENICSMGYINRGIKKGNHLGVIRGTVATAILVECCFMDNQNEINKLNLDNMANAIANGIMGKDYKASKEEVPQEKLHWIVESSDGYRIILRRE